MHDDRGSDRPDKMTTHKAPGADSVPAHRADRLLGDVQVVVPVSCALCL